MNQPRLGNLDVLRGVAAIAVCFYHFRRESVDSIGVVYSLSSYGYLGVELFFVISGFVIPLMLLKADFRWSDSYSFLLSRFLRLYPGYIASGVLAIVLWVLSSKVPGFAGEPPSFSFLELLSNGLLICDFNGSEWINGVYWTLAIEAQYYIIIAASFPLLISRSLSFRYGVLALWVVAPLLVGDGPTVFTWSALFSIGILCCLKVKKLVGSLAFGVFFIAGCVAHTLTKGAVSAAAGASAGFLILYLPELRSRRLIRIGGFSYSIYLTHQLVGGRVVNLASRLPNDTIVQSLALLLAVLLSIVAGALFFRFVERPSHEFSRRFRPKGKELAPMAKSSENLGR